MTLLLLLQIVATVATLSSTWLMGNKHITGPFVGLIGDVAFMVINALAGLWLLVPVAMLSFVIHTRNAIKWWKENENNT